MTTECSDCGNEYVETSVADLDSSDYGTHYLGPRTRNGQVLNVYARKTSDDEPWDPFEDQFFEFHRFDINKASDVDQGLLLDLLDNRRPRLACIVSLYRHSGDIWYRMDSRSMPDERWDVVRVAGLIKPSRDALTWWNLKRRHKGGRPVREQMLEAIDDVLEAYTAYCNGLYYIVDVAAVPVGTCPDCVDVEWHMAGSVYKLDKAGIDWLNFEIGVAMSFETKDHHGQLPGIGCSR